MKNILLIVTGSISAYKAISLANILRKRKYNIKVVLTGSVLNFINKITFSSQWIECYTDADEWNDINNVLHIELSKWCDICLVAPLTANTLGKISNGIADNLASCCIIALEEHKKLVLAPAMNTYMLQNKIVQSNFTKIQEYLKPIIIEPEVKMLACGVQGKGALADIETIADVIDHFIKF